MTMKMENKLKEKNLFGSDFDLFDFDDSFLLQVDADLKKKLHNKKDFGKLKKFATEEVEKSEFKENEKKESVDKSAKYYDLPLFIEDLNESDFFEKKIEMHSSKKKVTNQQIDEKGKQLSIDLTVKNCLSPILGPKKFHKNNVSSSTPLKSSDDTDSNKNLKPDQKDVESPLQSSQFDYLDADLFDEWDANDVSQSNTQKDTVTFSQALRLIEEAELAETNRKELAVTTNAANESIDMLTGEVVTVDIHNFLEDSFNSTKPVTKCNDKENFSDDSVIIIDDVNVKCKPLAAQKLNFDSKTSNCFNLDDAEGKKKDFRSICFSSDDDFDFFTQDLLGKIKENSRNKKPDQGGPNLRHKNDGTAVVENLDLNDSNVSVVNVKRRKRVNIIESDTTEDSPSPKFRRQRKPKIRNGRTFQDTSVREFYDLEAEVSKEIDVSSDEVEEEEDEYERSFLDEESYCTQNCSADMTAKYLESVKNLGRSGKFKIPATKAYNPKEVFSQAPEENNTEYQIDSFCVNDVEEETKTDLSDLEIAEKILEMDKKKRKKRLQKCKKIK